MALTGHAVADAGELLRERTITGLRRGHQFFVALTLLLVAKRPTFRTRPAPA